MTKAPWKITNIVLAATIGILLPLQGMAAERPITRGIPSSDAVKKQLTRGISPDQDFRARPDSSLPTMDVMIRFKFDSAELTPFAMKQLDAFGDALQSEELGQYTIVVEGHTDAAGSFSYNQGLSEQRARAVYDYLVTRHGIAANRLVPRGAGENNLFNPADPLAAENRRVTFINRGK